MAEAAKDPFSRTEWLSLAEQYERLAREAEHRTKEH